MKEKETIIKTRTANSNELHTYVLSEPLDEARVAKVEINADDGNLMIDQLNNGEPVLVSGTLQYFKKQGPPARTLEVKDGQMNFTIRGSRSQRPWIRFPWSACNAAHEWRIHLNPTVSMDLLAHSGGGNVKLDLAGTTLTSLSAVTGGGNIDVILPDILTDLNADINAGAGNVTVQLPGGIEARIHAESGLGKVVVDSGFKKIAEKTYQSDGYDEANKKVTIKATSGLGNVTISSR
jgi:hypothetical protein